MLPGSVIGEVSSVADLRIDFGAIQSASAEPPRISADLRVTRTELTSFFARSWHVTMAILPLTAIANPLEVPPATPSHGSAAIHRRGEPVGIRHKGSQSGSTLRQPAQTPGNGSFYPNFYPRRRRSGVEMLYLLVIAANWSS